MARLAALAFLATGMAGGAAAEVLPVLELIRDGGSIRIEARVTNDGDAPVETLLEIARSDAAGNTSRTRQRSALPPGPDPVTVATVSLGGGGRLDATLTVMRDGAVVARTQTQLAPGGEAGATGEVDL